MNTAKRMVGDEAEDVLQEAFLSAFQNIDRYRADATFGLWLKRIVVNKSISLLNKRKGLEFEEIQDFNQSFEELSVSEEALEVKKIKKAVSQLPDGFRTVLTLYLFEGYDHKEIAQILQITESTSKSQYNRAKKRLKQLLNQTHQKDE